MLRSSQTPVGHIVILATLALCVFATPVSGQDRRWVVFGTAGVASIGHADSEQGKAPVVGGGAAFQMVPAVDDLVVVGVAGAHAAPERLVFVSSASRHV